MLTQECDFTKSGCALCIINLNIFVLNNLNPNLVSQSKKHHAPKKACIEFS